MQRLRGRLIVGQRGDQAGERLQSAPGGEFHSGHGRHLTRDQALHDVRHVLGAEGSPRLRHLPAHHRQVARHTARALMKRHHHRIRRALGAGWAVRQRHLGDRAAGRVDPCHKARCHPQLVEGAAVQPGLQPQRQPQPHRACGGQRTACKGGTPGVPALAHGVAGVQVIRRRSAQVAGMFPTDAKALGLEADRQRDGIRSDVELSRLQGPDTLQRALCAFRQSSGGFGAGIKREGDLRHGMVLDGHRDAPGPASVSSQWLSR